MLLYIAGHGGDEFMKIQVQLRILQPVVCVLLHPAPITRCRLFRY